MLSPRKNHTAVNIGNKMFVIGGSLNSCEVFDNVTRKFTSIKILPKWISYLGPNKIVGVGYNIYLFLADETNDVKVYNFDVKNYVISLKTYLYLEYSKGFNCTKISIY